MIVAHPRSSDKELNQITASNDVYGQLYQRSSDKELNQITAIDENFNIFN